MSWDQEKVVSTTGFCVAFVVGEIFCSLSKILEFEHTFGIIYNVFANLVFSFQVESMFCFFPSQIECWSSARV